VTQRRHSSSVVGSFDIAGFNLIQKLLVYFFSKTIVTWWSQGHGFKQASLGGWQGV
jgi:hypothetical protein